MIDILYVEGWSVITKCVYGAYYRFRYCGCQKLFRSSYCEHHHRRAWVTAAPPTPLAPRR